MYAIVKQLPQVVQDTLASVGYGKADVEVSVVAEMNLMSNAYGDGYQGFTTILNLATGERETVRGSWGGSNPFESSPVDNDTRMYTLPAGAVVIKGQRGGGRPVSAHVYIASAGELGGAIAETVELSADERAVLDAHKSLNSGGRKDYFGGRWGGYYWDNADREPHTAVIARLAERGLLKVNKAGAVSITTEGKNALA